MLAIGGGLQWFRTGGKFKESIEAIRSEPDTNAVLKIDVEGAEWEVFSRLPEETLQRFEQIICEFHGLNSFHKLPKYLKVLEKLHQTHQCIHTHGNNNGGSYMLPNGIMLPDVLETCHVRRTDYTFSTDASFYPTDIDVCNNPDERDTCIGKWSPIVTNVNRRLRNLTVCAIFRDENHWLDEWICYHRAAGVEHFVLYNDDIDKAESDKILAPYVQQGFVENRHVPQFGYNWMERQSTLYYKTSHELANISKWCAFIDIDEFILPRKVDSIPEVLREYEEYEGVRLKWCIFGTSGYKLNPPTRINHLLHRGYDDLDLNQLEKSIIRSGCATSPEIHRFATFKNHQIVLPPEVMRINHYNATSWQHHRDVTGLLPKFEFRGEIRHLTFVNLTPTITVQNNLSSLPRPPKFWSDLGSNPIKE